MIFTSPYETAVFFARIVMPFSRSRSIESMDLGIWRAEAEATLAGLAAPRATRPA